MKISIPYFMVVTATASALLALGGCGSSQDASTASAGQRAQPASSNKSIPPQAQTAAAGQGQQKNQMDDMREQDAKKAQGK